MGASQKQPWKKYVKRAIVQGGGRGNVPNGTFRGEAAYVRRLRRIEVVILDLSMKLRLAPAVLDSLLQDMLDIKDVQPATSSGGADEGDEVPLPHGGATEGQAEDEA